MTDRQNDIRIAQIVGWGHVLDPLGTLTGQPLPDELTQSVLSGIPHYSSDIKAAWTLFAWLKQRDRRWEYEVLSDGKRAYCVISLTSDDVYSGEGETPAEAICRAFLSASSRAGEEK